MGSTAGSWIDAEATGESEIIYVALEGDNLERLKAGLLSTCELFFESNPAPLRVLHGTPDAGR